MATTITQMRGFDQLERKLAGLPPKVQKTIAGKVLRKGARPITKQAKRDAPVGETGKLKKHIKTGRARSRKRTLALVRAIQTKGAPHAHLVEKGTVPRKHKSGKSTGYMPAFPFALPAATDQQGAAASIVRTELGNEIEKAAKQ